MKPLIERPCINKVLGITNERAYQMNAELAEASFSAIYDDRSTSIHIDRRHPASRIEQDAQYFQLHISCHQKICYTTSCRVPPKRLCNRTRKNCFSDRMSSNAILCSYHTSSYRPQKILLQESICCESVNHKYGKQHQELVLFVNRYYN